jgi:hypothetical protein
MKYEEIKQKQQSETKPKEKLYSLSVTIAANSATRLSPFRMNKVGVQFPCLNVCVGNVCNVMTKAMGDTSQLLSVTCDLGVFSTSRKEAMDDILTTVLVDIIGEDGTLNLVEPKIVINGRGDELWSS